MRLLFILLLLPILAGAAPCRRARAASPAGDGTSGCHQPTRPGHNTSVTWQQHFAQANLAHDGHLTRAEATAGFPLIAKHFDDIDADHKAYVTENDVKSWRTCAAQRAEWPIDRQTN